MKYFRAYLEAFGDFFMIFGTILLTFHILKGDSMLAQYFLSMAFVCSVAGPVGLIIEKERKAK